MLFRASCKVTLREVEGERRKCFEECKSPAQEALTKETDRDMAIKHECLGWLLIQSHVFLFLQEYVTRNCPTLPQTK